MSMLDETQTRDLDSFEQSSLAKLYAGDDIVTSDSESKIRMLGSLRATKDCIACHDAKRGDLLGAFLYRLAKYER